MKRNSGNASGRTAAELIEAAEKGALLLRAKGPKWREIVLENGVVAYLRFGSRRGWYVKSCYRQVKV